MVPGTSYVKSGDVHLAYQTLGTAERDMVYLAGIFSHIELQWENPSYAEFLTRLSGFSRLIMMDMQGVGLSDRSARLPLLEEQMDDISAVLDRTGSNKAAVFGVSQAGPMAVLYAATNPGRVDALILYAAYASARRHEDYEWGRDPVWIEGYLSQLDQLWGTGSFLPQMAPSMVGNAEFEDWWGRFERFSSAPGNAVAYAKAHVEDDVRELLSAVSVPTLVIQRADDGYRGAGQGRYIANAIPNSHYVEIPGRDHLPYVGNSHAIVEEVEEFLTGVRGRPEPNRVLATVLFTDIVDSTGMAAAIGDTRWRALLDHHDRLVRAEVQRHRGRVVSTSGDGALAIFDGPARAINCATTLRAGVRDLGLEIRAGLHTGEVETKGDDVAGIGVHIGSRISALAGSGQILVSRTVKDLVTGSEIAFTDMGSRALKGVPDEWQVYEVDSAD